MEGWQPTSGNPGSATDNYLEKGISFMILIFLWYLTPLGAKVMSCETVKIRALDGYQNGNPEIVYVSDSGDFSKHFILGLRLYLNGDYADPPPGVLPPKPQIQNDDDCCTIL